MIINIGFSKPKTWKPFAWLIMMSYNIPYDHVFIRFHSDAYDRDLIYQASQTMVNFMSPSVFEKDNLIVNEFPIEISDDQKMRMIQFCIDNSGEPYGIKECFGLAWVRICDLFGKTVKNPFADGGSTYVCSELAGFILEQYAGVKFTKDQDDLTPLDIYNTMLSLKNG